MFSFNLVRWLKSRNKTRGKTIYKHKPALRLHLEELESRLAPAALIWTGGGGAGNDNWGNPANWSGGVPTVGTPLDLTFDNTHSAFFTTNDDMSGLTINSITITGTTPYIFSAGGGVAVTLGNPATTSGTITVNTSATATFNNTFNFTLGGASVLTGTLTTGSKVVTGLATAGLNAGMSVSGAGIPAGTTIASVNVPAAGDVTLSNAATLTGAKSLTFAGASSTEFINVQNTANLTLLGTLTQPAGMISQLTKQGAGTLTLSANNNTFSGPVTISSTGPGGNGVVVITNQNALGTGTTTINTNTELQVNIPAGGAVIPNTVIVNGNGPGGAGAILDISAPVAPATATNTWSGAVQMNSANGVSNTTFGVSSANETLRITGQISNSATPTYTVTKEGGGVLDFDPMAAAGNLYGGNTIVNAGLLEIGHPFALGPGGGTTIVNSTITKSGSLGLAYDPTNTFIPAAYLEYPQVQTVTLTGAAAGLTQFTLSYNGVTTAPITYNGKPGLDSTAGADANNIKNALDGLATIGGIGASVSVTAVESTATSPIFYITFQGSLGGMEIPTLNAAVTSVANVLTGTTVSGSAIVTGLISTAGLAVGMPVAGTGIPAGTSITAIGPGLRITLTANATNSGTVSLSFGPTAISVGVLKSAIMVTGTTAAGSINVTGMASTTALAVGMSVTGPGIPAGTTIATIAANQITLSANATASGTVALSFSLAPIGFEVPNEFLTLNGPGEAGLNFDIRGTLQTQGPAPVPEEIGALNNMAGDNAWEQTVTFWSSVATAENNADAGYYAPVAVTIGAVLNTNLTIDAVITDNAIVNGMVALNNSNPVADPYTVYSFSKTGNGRVILTNDNTFAAYTDVLQGILNLRDSGAMGLDTGILGGPEAWWGTSIELQADAKPDSSGLAGTYNLEFPTQVPFFLDGPGFNNEGALLNMAGQNKIEGPVYLGDSAPPPNSPLPNGTGASIGVAPDPDPSNIQGVTANDLSQLTIDGVISDRDPPDPSGLTKVGYGELVLTGTNTYHGPTTGRFSTGVTPQTEIEQGWITVENDQALGDLSQTTQSYLPPVQVDAGASLVLKEDLNGNSLDLKYNLFLAGFGITNRFAWLNQMGALVNLDGDNTVNGFITLNGAAGIGVELDGASTTPPVSQLTLSAIGTGAMIMDGSAPGGILKNGSQRLIIAEPGTYTGSTINGIPTCGFFISEGVVRIENDDALGLGTAATPISTLVASGGALELGTTVPQLTGGISRGLDVVNNHLMLNGTGSPIFGDAPVTILQDDNEWDGPVTLNSNLAVTFDNQLANETLPLMGITNANLTGGGTISINTTTPGSSGINAVQTITFNGSITGGTFTLTVTSPTGVVAVTAPINVAILNGALDVPVIVANIQAAMNALGPTFGGTVAGISTVTRNSPIISVQPNARFVVTGVIDDGGSIAAVASPLVHDYEFKTTGSYADLLGGPSMVNTGGAIALGTGYTWGGYPAQIGANQGLTVTGALPSPNNYSIQMDFEFNQIPPPNPTGYDRILDWKDRTTDDGLYVFGGPPSNLNYYPTGVSGTYNWSPGTPVDLVVTRDGTTNQLIAYINGVQDFITNDVTNDAVESAANKLLFFIDDFLIPDEISSGTASDIKIYNRPLTPAEVTIVAGGGTLGSAGAAPTGTPADLTVAGGGELLLSGANTYRGSTFVDKSILTIANNQALGNIGISEVQTLTLTNPVNNSTQFTLSFSDAGTAASATTPTIIYTGNAATDIADITNDLDALATIGQIGGSVSVTDSVVGNITTFTITFSGSLTGFNQNQMGEPSFVPGSGITTSKIQTLVDGQGGTIVQAGAQLQMQGGINVAGEPLQIQGQGDPSNPEVQTITAGDTPGAFAVSFKNPITSTTSTSVGLPVGASALQVQAALDQMLSIQQGSGLGGGLVDVTQIAPGVYQVVFDGTLYGTANLPMLGVVPLAEQIVSITGSSGTFTLSFPSTPGTTTPAIAPTIQASGGSTAASSLQNALNTLLANASQPGGGTGTAMVLASGTPGTYLVTFGGSLAGAAVPQLVPGNFTGTAFAIVTSDNGASPFTGRTLAGGSAIDTPTQWFSIGPDPVTNAQVFNGGPTTSELVTGRVTGVVTDPVDPNVMYISTAGGGAWKTVDATAATPLWTPLFDGVSAVDTVQITGKSGSFTLTFTNPLTGVTSTTPTLAYNASTAQVQSALNTLPAIGGAGASVQVNEVATPGVNEVQTLDFTVGGASLVANSTKFTLSFNGYTSPTSIVYTGSAQDADTIASALNSASFATIGGIGGTVSVSSTALGVFTIIFGGSLAQQPQAGPVTATIVGGPPFGPVVATVATPGALPFVNYTITFGGGTLANQPLPTATPALTVTPSVATATVTMVTNGVGPNAVIFSGAIAIAPSDPATLYLGTGEGNNSGDTFYGNGVYVSHDYGQTWALVTNFAGSNPLNGLSINKIVVDAANPNLIWVATSDQQVNSNPAPGSVGIWRFNLVGGGTWTNISNPAVAPSAPPGTLSAASWTDIAEDGFGNLIAAFGVAGGSAENGVYTITGPATAVPVWSANILLLPPVGAPHVPPQYDPKGVFGVIKITRIVGTNNFYFAIGDGVGGLNCLAIYDSVGMTCTVIAFPAASAALYPLLAANIPNYLSPQADYDTTILDLNANNFFVGGVDPGTGTNFVLHVTNTNGDYTGTSFVDVSEDTTSHGPHTDEHALALDAKGNLILGGDGGVWRLDAPLAAPAAGSPWDDLNGTGLAITEINGITTNPTNPDNVLYGAQDVGTGQWNGSTWTQTDGGDGGWVLYDPNNPNVAYHDLNGSLQVSTTGGATWTPTGVATSAFFPFAISSNSPGPNTSDIILGGTAGAIQVFYNYVTSTFTSTNLLSSPSAPVVGVVQALAIAGNQGPFQADPTFPNVTDLGPNNPDTSTVYISDGSTIYVTKDDGSTWSAPRGPGLLGGTQIINLQVDPTDRDHVFAVTGGLDIGQGFSGAAGKGHVFESFNAGQSWIDISAGLPDLPCWYMTIDPRNGNLYLGTDVGVYTLTGGVITATNTWEKFGAGLPDVAVFNLNLNQNTNIITAGTYGRGAYQFFLDNATVDSGALRAAAGSNLWNGPVVLAGAATISAQGNQALQNGAAVAQLTILGSITDLSPSSVLTVTGTTTVGSNVITGLTTTTGLTVGMEVTGTGLPPGTLITAVSPLTSTITLSQNATVAATNSLTFTNTLTKAGYGDVILDGANGYVGDTVVQQGNLIVETPTALGNTSHGTAVLTGAVLQLATSMTGEPLFLYGNGADIHGHYTGAVENISNNNTYTGVITLETNSTIGVDAGSSLTITNTSPGAIADPGGASGQFSLTKEGKGLLTLAVADTYEGGTTINQGDLLVQNAGALGAAGTTTTVLDGAQLQLQSSVTTQNLVLTGIGDSGTGALLNVSGNNTWGSTTTAITLTSNAAFGSQTTPAGVVAIGVANATDTLTINSPITEPPAAAQGLPNPPPALTLASGLAKVGLGTLTLTQTDTYSGTTYVKAGILDVQNSNALGLNDAQAIQRVTTFDPGVTDTFTLTFNGATTPAEPFGTSATQLQNDLNALATIGANGVHVGVNVIYSGNNEVQTLTLTGAQATVTQFNLTFNGTTSTTVTYTGVPNADAAAIASALNLLVGVPGTFTVTPDVTGTIFTITFGGTLGDSLQSLLQAKVTAGIGAANVAETDAGAGGPSYIYTVTFIGATLAGPQPLMTTATYNSFGPPANPGGAPSTIMVASASTVADGGIGTQVFSGATLALDGDPTHTGAPPLSIPATETLYLNGTGATRHGALDNVSGNNAWNGTVTLQTSAAIDAAPTTQVTLTNTVQDPSPALVPPSNLTAGTSAADTGTVILTDANTYTGNTYIQNGALNIQNPTALGTETSAEQTLAITGTGGSFTLFFNGYPATVTTGPVPFNVTAAQLQSFLNSASMLGSASAPGGGTGTAAVTGTGGNFTVTFGGSLTGLAVPILLAPHGNFVGNTNATVTDLQEGHASGTFVSSGAALQMQSAGGFTESSGKPLYLLGNGLNSGGALENVAGSNTWGTTPIVLAGNSSVGADAGSNLNISQPITDNVDTQTITFIGFNPGDLYNLSFNGLTTSNITYSAAAAANIAAITAALDALPTISLLNGTVNVTHLAGNIYQVAFGGPMAGFSWPQITGAAVGSSAGTFNFGTPTMASSGFGVNKFGTGTVVYASSLGNYYTGLTDVHQGLLELADPNSGTTSTTDSTGLNYAIQGNLQVGDGVLAANSAIAQLEGNNQIAPTSNVTVLSDGELDVNNFSETLNNLTINGGMATTGFGASGGTLVLNNLIINDGTLSLPGTGASVTVNGNVTMTGGTIDLDGASSVLTLNGAASAVTATSDASGSATIAGRGALALGSVTRTFTVNPGTQTTDLLVTAAIKGSGGAGLTKAGAGRLEVAAADTYTGSTTINNGDVQVDDVQTISFANFVAGDKFTLTYNNGIHGGTTNAITYTGTIGTPLVPGTDDNILAALLQLLANIMLGGGVTVDPIDANDFTIAFTGQAATSPFPLNFNIVSSALGSMGLTRSNDLGAVNVGSPTPATASLSGTGSVGSLGAGGFIYGTINPGANGNPFTTGILRVNGPAALLPSTTLFITTGDSASGFHPNPIAGLDYDQLFVNGTLFLNNAILMGAPQAGVQVNDQFTIIQTTGTISGAGTTQLLDGYLAPTVNLTADIFSGNTFVIMPSTTGLSPGMLVTGAGIPANTVITFVGGTFIDISQPATTTSTLALAFTPPTPIPQGGAVFLNGQKYIVTYNPTSVVLNRQLATFQSFTMVSSINPTVYGQESPIIVTAVPEAGASLATANPVVSFLIDGATTVNVPMNPVTGIAVLDPQTQLNQVWAPGSSHTISASFFDSNNVFASGPSVVPKGSPVTQSINLNTVSINVSSNPVVSATAPIYGQDVTLTATLLPVVAPNVPGASNPTNNVEFIIDPGTPSQQIYYEAIFPYTGPPSSVSANLPIPGTSLLSVGTHKVDVFYVGTFPAYTGDGDYAATPAGSPAVFTLTYVKDGTTVNFTPPPTPSSLGQNATFDVTVTPNLAGSTGVPQGTLRFYDGATTNPPLQDIHGSTSFLYTGGTTQFVISTLAQGPHTIFAVFTDSDLNYAGSTASTAFTVSKATTATNFVSTTPASPTYGQSVNVLMQVVESPAINASYGARTGTISLYNGAVLPANLLGTSSAIAANGDGTVTTLAGALPAGTYTLTMVYSGDGTFATSMGSVVLTVLGATTTTKLAATPVAGQTWNNAVTLTATVTGSFGNPPAGSQVTFVDVTTGTTLGTTTINAAGVATLTTSALSAASHQITATYHDNIDINYQDSTGTLNNYPVTGAPTTVTTVTANWSNSPTTPVYGQPVMLTATVTSPGGPVTAGVGSTVSFYDGAALPANLIASGTVGAGGIASITTSLLSAATHNITAVYKDTADSFFTGVNTPGLLNGFQVNKSPTSIALTSSSGPSDTSATNQAVTYTATVTTQLPSNGAGVTAGTVTFFDNGTQIGSPVTVNAATGQATSAAVTYASASTHNITATYNPPVTAPINYLTSSTSNPGLTQTVIVTTGTTTSLSFNPTTSYYGNATTIMATVTAASGPSQPASGTVTFKDGATPLAGTVSYQVTAGGYVATLTTAANFAIASHSITATYSGNLPLFSGSSITKTLVVNPATTQVALLASPSPSNYGNAVTFSATVTVTSGGTPGTLSSGTVVFKNGTTTLAGTVSYQTTAGGYVATLTTTPTQLVAANDTISASYGGTSIFGPSSTSTPLTVNKAGTQVAVISSLSSPMYGQAVTFTAVVSLTTGGTPGTPPGSVTFKDTLNSVTTTLGNGTLKSKTATSATYTFTTSTTQLKAGDNAISAVYNPSNVNFAASTGFVNPTSGNVFTVNQAATTVTLTSTPGNWALGQATTFHVAVTTPTGQIPTGSVLVTITDPTSAVVAGYPKTVALSGGKGTFSYTFTGSNGNYSVEVDYNSPSPNFSSSTTTVTQDVTNTRISLAASPNPSIYTQTVTLTATVTSYTGFPPPSTGDTVSFYDGTTLLGTVNLNSSGKAVLAISTLSVGTHEITVVFNPVVSGLDSVTLSPSLAVTVKPKGGRLIP